MVDAACASCAGFKELHKLGRFERVCLVEVDVDLEAVDGPERVNCCKGLPRRLLLYTGTNQNYPPRPGCKAIRGWCTSPV